MPNNKLHDELEKLRTEVNEITDTNDEAKQKLISLISDLEKKLSAPNDITHHHNLMQNVKTVISHFETDHPRATAILNDIMVTLSNMGI